MKDTNSQQEPIEKKQRRVLRLGSRLLENAYALDGTLLLRAGAKIETLSKLERLSRPDVRFGDNRSTEIPLDLENEAALDAAAAHPDPRVALFEKNLEKASKLKQQAVGVMESVFAAVAAGESIDLELARETVAVLLNDLLEDSRALVSLTELKNADAYTYTHSVNVGILAMHLALHTEYRDNIEDIGVGSLLHDIGKAQIPNSILNKEGPLNEAEMQQMKRHPEIGTERLKQCGETREIVLSCVLNHHEKISGGGYPHGKRGRHICPYAMITSIADIYDALTTDRPYRPAMNPKDALMLMAREMSKDLHEGLLQCFISILGYYPIGSIIELSNGFTARVLNNYASHPNEPTVALISDPNGEPVPGTPVVDLVNERGLSITRFVKQETGTSLPPGIVRQIKEAA